MRYQNRYPKTMSGAEIRILESWNNPVTGLGVNGGRSSRSLTDGQVKRAVNGVRNRLKNGRSNADYQH